MDMLVMKINLNFRIIELIKQEIQKLLYYFFLQAENYLPA